MVTTATRPEGPTGELKGDIEVSNKLPSRSDLEKIADWPVLDGSGQKIAFKDLYSSANGSRRVLIIFIRHFFCGVCAPHLHSNCLASLRILTSFRIARSICELFHPSSRQTSSLDSTRQQKSLLLDTDNPM